MLMLEFLEVGEWVLLGEDENNINQKWSEYDFKFRGGGGP